MLLLAPFWVTEAPPPTVPSATVSTTWVSLQLTILSLPYSLPISPALAPCVAPNPLPVNVTWVPGDTLVGEILVRVGGVIVNATTLLWAPFWVTEAHPPTVPSATVATTWVSLQLTIDAAAWFWNVT